jgi:MscS family membrane protein
MASAIRRVLTAESLRQNRGAENSDASPGFLLLIQQFEIRRPFPVLPKRLACLGTEVVLIFLVILFCSPTWAQIHKPAASEPPPPQIEAPKDPLGRTTPRRTVLGFLTVARDGRDELAAQYLNTRLSGNSAAVLAHQLFVVLDRRLPPRLNELSDLPEGSVPDPLKPNEDLVGTIKTDDLSVDIFVERVDRGKSGLVWLFSSKTLDSIPQLYDEIDVISVEHILPEFFIKTRVASISLFEWVAVLVGMPLLYFLTVLLSRALNSFGGVLRRRVNRKPDLPNPELLPNPIRLLLVAFAIQWAISKVSLPLLARQFWSSTATLITIASGVWLLILLTNWGEEYVRRILLKRNLTGVTSTLHLMRWVVDLLIIVAGVFVTLHYFGVNPTAALAGVGVGGIAVAFAAQKTLENVIGGVSLIFDQAVRVGDILKVGDATGRVEDIGLRSTRIRTPDRTVVSVPNGQIANMTLENLSSRDKFWFHPILALRYGTTSPQMYIVLDHIRTLLEENPNLEHTSSRVRFLHFGPSSLDIEIFAYVLARDWNQFLEIQEGLLLSIMECIESRGVQFAMPAQTILVGSTASPEGVQRAVTNAPTPNPTPAGNLTIAKHA